MVNPPEPSIEFDSREPSWEEIQEVIKKARKSSAIGPSGVPYRINKNCLVTPQAMDEDPESDQEEG